jgi:hypothetical protein
VDLRNKKEEKSLRPKRRGKKMQKMCRELNAAWLTMKNLNIKSNIEESLITYCFTAVEKKKNC